MEFNTSTILIVNDVDVEVSKLIKTLPLHDTRIIKNPNEDKNEFLIKEADAAIKESYIASARVKYILLVGDTFSIIAQNRLLKVLEEPPLNVIFLFITNSKNSILPTVLSRMPHVFLKTKQAIKECTLNISKLDLKEVYTFLKENQRIGKIEAKELIESILYKVNSSKLQLSQNELDRFSKAIKLCNLNSRPINVLSSLLLNLMAKR